MTEALGLVLVAWLVYISDALWWITPERVVLSGRRAGEMRAQLGPAYTIRGDNGVFVPRLAPPFERHFELDAAAEGGKRAKDAAIVAAAEAAMDAAKPLDRLGAWLWWFCFGIAPALLIVFGLRRVWLPLLIALFTAATVIVMQFARAWRTLYPADRDGWKGHALPMILSPLAAICAADALTRRACAPFDGFAVLGVLAANDDFLRIARRYYFSPERHRLQPLVAARGLEGALLEPPIRTGADMEGYCPRCHTQLIRSSGDCPECLDVPIVAFGAPTPSGAPSDTFQSVAPR